MKQVDYIVVGIGLAGISFCEQLRKNNKQFVVFDNASQQSSTVAGGLYNPVVLKRFTAVWKCQEQLGMAMTMYAELETLLQTTLDYKIPVYRKFTSLEEQNNWFTASDKPVLSEYLSTKIVKNKNANIEASFGYGEVLQTGRVDVKTLIEAYKKYLLEHHLLLESSFNYSHLVLDSENIQYKDLQTKHIVFAEGYGVEQNPFFKQLPLAPAKGELITIKAPKLNIDYVLKAGVFIIPLGNDLYSVGSTYEWDDLSAKVTERAKKELVSKLEKIINCEFEVVNQVAGVRPTTDDRRPLVGEHPTHKNVFVLNGLGTRGVIVGPYVAEQLYNLIENKRPLDTDIDIARFLKKKIKIKN